MPIYEYRCQTCNEVTEAFVRSGKEPTACPKCGAETLTRLISRAGVIFKGSGFYVNDSKGASKSTSGSSDSDSSSAKSEKKESDSTSSTKSESSSSSTSDSGGSSDT